MRQHAPQKNEMANTRMLKDGQIVALCHENSIFPSSSSILLSQHFI